MPIRRERQGARQSKDIGGGGEVLGHDADALSRDAELLRDGHHRRAHDAAIDELTGGEALEVGEALRGDAAGAERHEIGGRAADVEEERVAERACGQRRARVPIR